MRRVYVAAILLGLLAVLADHFSSASGSRAAIPNAIAGDCAPGAAPCPPAEK